MCNRIFMIFKINIIKTILLNIKLFHLRDAIRLPLLVYGRYSVYNVMSLQRGQIELKCPVRTGLVRLNRRIGYNIGNHLEGSLNLQGKIIVNGGGIDIGQGCNISVRQGAILELAENLAVTGLTNIHVYHCVKIGKHTMISWNVHVHDTDYHYFIKEDKIFSRDRTISIGENVWIGHEVTITKGSQIPSNCIVASYSLVNCSFPESPNGLMLAGIPAQIKRFNVRPINDFIRDSEIDRYFKIHQGDTENGVALSVFE